MSKNVECNSIGYGLAGYDITPASPHEVFNLDVTPLVDFDRKCPPPTIDVCDKVFTLLGKPRVNSQTATKDYYYSRLTCPREVVIVKTWNGDKYSACMHVIDEKLVRELEREEDKVQRSITLSQENSSNHSNNPLLRLVMAALQ